jgi:pantothenate kinase
MRQLETQNNDVVATMVRCCGGGGVIDKVDCDNPVDRVGGVRLYGRMSCCLVGAGGDGNRGRLYPPWRRR